MSESKELKIMLGLRKPRKISYRMSHTSFIRKQASARVVKIRQKNACFRDKIRDESCMIIVIDYISFIAK